LPSIAMRRPNNRLPPCAKIGCVLPAQHQSRFFSIAVRVAAIALRPVPIRRSLCTLPTAVLFSSRIKRPVIFVRTFPALPHAAPTRSVRSKGSSRCIWARLSFHTGPARQSRGAMHVCRNVRPMPYQWISMRYACSCRRMTVSDVGSAYIPVKVSTTSLRSRFDRNGSCHGREMMMGERDKYHFRCEWLRQAMDRKSWV